MTDLASIARLLDEAAVRAIAVPQVSATIPLSLEEAYAVQRAGVERRVGRGERVVGVKMGFTSRSKAAQMGVFDVIYGRLTDGMVVEDGGHLDLARFVHPRVEPELAVRLGRPLEGRVGIAEAWAAVEAVAPALEIIDSRYRDFRFSLEDVVADNSSSSGFVVGAWRERPADVSNLGIVMECDGRPVQVGSTAAVLGNPVRALAAAVRMLAAAGERLDAGSIVLTGAATPAEPLRPGMAVLAEMEELGRVGFMVAAGPGR
jgi:2-oxo-3-hexenedioate decarboxylase